MSAGRLRARHYASGRWIDLSWSNGVIQDADFAAGPAPELVADFVAPAFFDLQINGGCGRGFSSAKLTVDDVRSIVDVCQRHGVAAFCPTLVTNSRESLRSGLRVLRRAVESDWRLERALPAFHLEGPYISPLDGPRGAHPREHVRPPDWDEFQELQEDSGGRIRLVTLAPEVEGGLRLIERLSASGVVAAIGHTAASAEEIRAAVQAGARISTHLFNGCAALLPRHENGVFEQLASDELMASIITDGYHLPPALIRCIVRVKTPARLILTCDASSLAGAPPGRYQLWGRPVEVVPEGKVVVSDSGQRTLAGSWHFTDVCVCHAVHIGAATLAEAVRMASDHPRMLLGLPLTRLEPGMPADLATFSGGDGRPLMLQHSIIDGELVSASNES